MKELSLHILDVSENGISAGATLIQIKVDEARKANRLKITISDNGRGISDDTIEIVTNPFFTTRTTRRVGLGLSLLRAAAERCDGFMRIISTPGKGTSITAEFSYDHIDRAPLGDIVSTMVTLIMGNPDVDFEYCHHIDEKQFLFSTRDIKNEMGNAYMENPSVYATLYQRLQIGMNQLISGEI